MILVFNVGIIRIYVNVKGEMQIYCNIQIVTLMSWLNPATVQSYSYHEWIKIVFFLSWVFCVTCADQFKLTPLETTINVTFRWFSAGQVQPQCVGNGVNLSSTNPIIYAT